MFESAKQYARGIIKRLYWLAPTLFLDPFDFAERYWGIMYNPPQWLAWVLLTIGFVVGLVVAVIAIFSQEGFQFLTLGKGFVIGALIGTVCEWISKVIKWLASKKT